MSISASEAIRQPRAAAARVELGTLRVTLRDGRELAVPIDWFPWLAAGSPEQRARLAVIEDGAGIWWDLLDDGVSVPGLFGLPEWP